MIMFFSKTIYFLLFIPLIAYILWYILKGHKIRPSMKVSTLLPFVKGVKSYKNYLVHIPFALRTIAISMVILVLARPVSTNNTSEKNIEGIDIMMAIDISTSMMAMDLEPNRIDAAKEVAAEFINARPNDNIGLTIFAGESFTQCPLTIDHATTLNLLGRIGCEMVLDGIVSDGTAIGTGLANSISRLKDSKAKSKVIILLTDGSNNRGEITPLKAAEMAKLFDIKIYTIAVGTTSESAPFPYGGQIINVPVEIDEGTLRSIASTTGGKFFRATSKESLSRIYSEIDEMERTKLHVREYTSYEEEFMIFAIIALAALLAEILLRNTILRKIP